ncbi:Cell wall integrity/stress response component-like protein [Heracleum sosnowskyi]|uniref:Cell wall integrity/stress response component-like protein n=1 Tax=Heracleum sosnowskyi TaxID=360622 RepID=A0AAD8H7C9_9APIA|nr:Cell wall integrity/stress response component-like protein [Heracleum sosnowskyi]
MSPLHDPGFRKVLIFIYLLCLFSSLCLNSGFAFSSATTQTQPLLLTKTGRKLLDLQSDENKPIKKITTSTSSTTLKNQTKPMSTSSAKNQTKPIKTSSNLGTSSLTKNQTKLIKTTSNLASSTKNQTKIPKLTTSSSDALLKNKTKLNKPTSTSNSPTIKTQPKKLNSTSSKPSSPTKKSSDLTTKPKQTNTEKPKTQKPKQPTWIDEDEEEDLVSDFRDLPSRFQETLLPDLERFSTSSKVYLTRANKDLTNGFKPLVGKTYAPAIASVVSCAFILIPLILVSLIFNRIKAYFSLQKIIIFIQIYLAIYFTILCLSALVTGLEPLKFFYATSQSTYICIQVLQTLGYVLYLLVLLMYLVLVFSTETGLVSKLLGLGQTFVGFAVGLHYYVKVFHRAVLHQPPKSSWKIHAIYATCFLAICLLDRAERRKKAYLEEGGAEGKKS